MTCIPWAARRLFVLRRGFLWGLLFLWCFVLLARASSGARCRRSRECSGWGLVCVGPGAGPVLVLLRNAHTPPMASYLVGFVGGYTAGVCLGFRFSGGAATFVTAAVFVGPGGCG